MASITTLVAAAAKSFPVALLHVGSSGHITSAESENQAIEDHSRYDFCFQSNVTQVGSTEVYHSLIL